MSIKKVRVLKKDTVRYSILNKKFHNHKSTDLFHSTTILKLCIYFFFFHQSNLLAENEINAFNYDIKGKLVRQETINFPSGSKFISFKHEGGFDTTLGRYGFYSCSGSIFYNKDEILDDMTFACEFRDQEGSSFFSRGRRLKGTQIDRSVGRMKIIEGKGFWKNYINFDCSYGLEYVEKIVFVNALCKKSR